MNEKVHMRLCLALTITVLALMSCKDTSSGGSGSPACDAQECKVRASDGIVGQFFGAAIGMDDDLLVVGAPEDGEAADHAGAVYVYARNGDQWDEVQKILASDAAGGDRLGGDVAVDGDVIVAGAHADGTNGNNAGAVYVFRNDGSEWIQEQKLLASDGEAEDGFGTSVSLADDVIAVGASGDDDGGESSGAVYVFRFGGLSWAEEQKLAASDAAAADRFGFSVAAYGTTISVGAPYNDGPRDSGAGYVFRFSMGTWSQEAKIVAQRAPLDCEPPTPVADQRSLDGFGTSTDIDGTLVAFGAPRVDLRQRTGLTCQLFRVKGDSGVIYLYRFDGGSAWPFEARLQPLGPDGSLPNAMVFLGNDVDIDDASGIVVGGGPGDRDNGVESGAGFIFVDSGTSLPDWKTDQKIKPADATLRDKFGATAATDGNVATFGATGDSDDGPHSGSVYVYPL